MIKTTVMWFCVFKLRRSSRVLKRLKAPDMTTQLKSEVEALSEQLANLELENQKQAQQLAETNKHNKFLVERVTKVMHIKSLEELVDSLEKLRR